MFTVAPQTIADMVAEDLLVPDGGLYDDYPPYENGDLTLFLLEDVHLAPFADSVAVLGATWGTIYGTLESLGYTYATVHDRCDDCGAVNSLTTHTLPAGHEDTGLIIIALAPYLAQQCSLASGHLCYALPHGTDVLSIIK